MVGDTSLIRFHVNGVVEDRIANQDERVGAWRLWHGWSPWGWTFSNPLNVVKGLEKARILVNPSNTETGNTSMVLQRLV